MDRNEAASIIKRYLTCTDIMHNCNGKCTLCRYYPSDEEKESALKLAIKALEKAPTALDHIHNVVAEREYQRGYEQAKEEYDHKLTIIKSRIKDYYYSKGYKQGKADAEKEMHDNILRYRMPEPWEGE